MCVPLGRLEKKFLLVSILKPKNCSLMRYRMLQPKDTIVGDSSIPGDGEGVVTGEEGDDVRASRRWSRQR